MNRYVCCMCLCLYVCCVAEGNSEQPRECSKVVVEVDGFKAKDDGKFKGQVIIALISDPKTFYALDARKAQAEWPQVYKLSTIELEEKLVRWVVEDIPFGEYMVAVVHDENKNGFLDSNLVGIPKEPYGYSRGARHGLRHPGWEKVKIIVDKPTTEVTVTVR